MKTYFITGSTGVVGNAIAQTLLQRADTRLKLLVRAQSPQELAQRAHALRQNWGMDAGAPRAKDRVEVLQGDVTLPLWGMEQSVHARMAQECTHIIHCAAMVRMNLPLQRARESALGGAQGLVHLARACQAHGQLEKIEYVSTVGVGGRLAGTLAECAVTQARSFHNTYEQAKAEAEDYLRGQTCQGLPLTMHRPSMVVGHSQTGRVSQFQIFYHLIEFLSGLRTLGVLPRLGDMRLDIVPVDYVADAVAWSSTQAATTGRTLHLCSGPQGSIGLLELRRHLCEQLVQSGKRAPAGIFIPTVLFRALLPAMRALAPPRLRRAIATLPVFFDYMDDRQAFGNTLSQQMLVSAGVHLPRVEGYLPKVLSYYWQQKLCR